MGVERTPSDISQHGRFPWNGATPKIIYLSKMFHILVPSIWGYPHLWKPSDVMILWMEEILHQLIDGLSHYLKGFNHPRWCRISSIHRMLRTFILVHLPIAAIKVLIHGHQSERVSEVVAMLVVTAPAFRKICIYYIIIWGFHKWGIPKVASL